jgi:hypothetical protein
LPIPVFRNSLFGEQKQKKTGILRISFFPVFSGGIFHRKVVLERSQEFRFLDAITGIFRRNSYGTGIPVFSPDSSGFLRIPARFLFPPNSWYN